METVLAVLVVTTLSFMLAGLVRELARRAWLEELHELTLKERNRNRFGALRTDLMSLARKDEIDPRGHTFATLYRTLSLLMQNPASYDAVAYQIIAMKPEESRADGRRVLTEDEKVLYRRFGQALDHLCRDYVWVYRYGAMLIDHLSRGRENPPLWVRTLWRRMEESKVYKTRVRPVREAQKRLEHFASFPYGNNSAAAPC